MRIELRDCWPGLARLWRAGLPSGLVVAVVFSILLNATLIASLIYPTLMPQSIKVGLWIVLAVAWAAGWVDARRLVQAEWWAERQDPQLDLFLAARAEYLQCHWDSAEGLLAQLLRVAPDDVEARLMLATLFRHGDRLVEAKEQLRRLQRWRRAAQWNHEIRCEWERIMRRESESDPQGLGPEPAQPPQDQPLPEAA